jgi:hypothetical protein
VGFGVLIFPNVINLSLHFTNEMQYNWAGEFIKLLITICCHEAFVDFVLGQFNIHTSSKLPKKK